jgi:hypothetical protein
MTDSPPDEDAEFWEQQHLYNAARLQMKAKKLAAEKPPVEEEEAEKEKGDSRHHEAS